MILKKVQEMTVSLAAAQDIIMDAAVWSVWMEVGSISSLEVEKRTAKLFSTSHWPWT